jgi:predicted aconitase with swiveling domain
MGTIILNGTVVVPGQAEGLALVANEPLSFWGGYDQKTGEIIDKRHVLSGESAKGKVLAIPFTRGSSTTTAVLLDAIRAQTAPAAIITTGADFFLALASVVADELYSSPLTVVTVTEKDFAKLKSGDYIQITNDGKVVISR